MFVAVLPLGAASSQVGAETPPLEIALDSSVIRVIVTDIGARNDISAFGTTETSLGDEVTELGGVVVRDLVAHGACCDRESNADRHGRTIDLDVADHAEFDDVGVQFGINHAAQRTLDVISLRHPVDPISAKYLFPTQP